MTYPKVEDLKEEGERHVEALPQQRELPRLDELHGHGHQRLGVEICWLMGNFHFSLKK